MSLTAPRHLLGRAVYLLADVLGRTSRRADRWARMLTGAPDPVDQHAAETPSYYVGQSPVCEDSPAFQRLQNASRVDWPDSTRSPAADASAGRRHALAEISATREIQPVESDEWVIVLMSLIGESYPRGDRDYPGEIKERAEVVAREMHRDGFVLARKLPDASQRVTRSEVSGLAAAGADVSRIPPEQIIGNERGTS